MSTLSNTNEYKDLISSIGETLEHGRKKSFIAINNLLVQTYWKIGKLIVEYEQKGEEKAEYGTKLFESVAKDLRKHYGKGFSRTNVIYMRFLYMKYPKSQTLSDFLSWSHYVELLGVDDDLARSFYEKQTLKERWSVRKLKRQKNSQLFERIALSKDKKGVLQMAEKGQVIEKSPDILKEPYILEFLGIPENYKYSEKELEQLLLKISKCFFWSWGKGLLLSNNNFALH